MNHTPAKRIAIPIQLHWNLPWHIDAFQGISDYGRKQGWKCVVDPHLDGATGTGHLTGYDGIVGRINSDNAIRIAEQGVTAVNLQLNKIETGIHRICVDTSHGAKIAAEHLVAHGYRRFGHVTNVPAISTTANTIVRVFAQTIQSMGLPKPDIINISNDALEHAASSKQCLQALTRWIDAQPKPIGVYVYLFDFARYLAQICEQLGLRVPDDVGILVQDADYVNTTHITPTLSAIDYDFWEQGQQAAALLDRLMRGEQVEPRARFMTARRVIVRESTDVFLCDDPLVSAAMRYIAENCQRTLTVNEIAEAVDTSDRTLHRRFIEVRGQTINHEIARLRTDHITRMLIETDLPLSDIAYASGFSTASHFTRYFKKQAGMTPSAYRKQNRQNN